MNENKENTKDIDTKKTFAYICKKTERIVAAVYLITDIDIDMDILKEKIRGNALEILSSVHKLNSSSTKVLVHNGINQLQSHLYAAMHAGRVSQMNNRILQQELQGLYAAIGAYEVSTRHVQLPENFFAVDTVAHTWDDFLSRYKVPIAAPEQSIQYKGHHKRHSDIQYQQERNMTPLSTNETTKQTKVTTSESTKERAKQRRGQILALLQQKDKISIRDVAEVISDCSEKTLQRELLALVGQGVLKKEGERRWSTYSLA